MAMLKLRYMVRQVAKGKEYWYFRRDGRYIKTPHPTDPAFKAKYDRLVKDDLPGEPIVPGSFGELVKNFLASPAYASLSEATKPEYKRLLDKFRELWGELPAKKLSRRAVLDYRDALSKHPRQANYSIQILRRLLNWAVDRGVLKSNPASKPGRLKEGEGHKPWPLQAIRAFQEKNKDDPVALRALALGLYTGQRRGDVVRMTRHDYDGQRIAVVQSKTGTKVWVPIHSELRRNLESDNAFMLTIKPFKPNKFSKVFHAAVLNADLDGLTFHGLRKTASVMLAEAGCTEAELQSILGHRTVQQSADYRKDAERAKLAKSAIRKLERKKPKV